MKLLFIGGTGIISSACSKLAVEQGIELYLLNRSQSIRPPAIGAHLLKGDIRQPDSVTQAIHGLHFDAVVDWVAYTPAQVQIDLDLFHGRTNQYVFISSASAYQKPPSRLPVSESTLLDNPFWQYSRDKIACENLLVEAFRAEKYPITIVRPSHTYDPAYIPIHGGWTVIDRMQRGEEIIVHGDGTSLWTLTHHADFALGFNGLLGNSRAIGEAVHITSDEWLTWDKIHHILAEAAGVKARIVHVPSDVINRYDPEWGASMLGDKAHSAVFDNSKIKQLVPGYHASIPFSRGAEEILAWYRANPNQQVVDARFNDLCDRIISAQKKAYPQA
ncbi:MAG: NAD-dependent dehydratase [Anaerolinea sp.]|nr:NAD-dependent dehydratase [Anaerolinea sp.]